MAKKQVNVALIGAQFMGKAHSNAWRQVSRAFTLPVQPVLKVLCGKFPQELAIAEQYGWAETDLNWRRVVNRPDIDVVDICAPNNLHAPIAIEAAKAGKHVFCEKPLATTRADAEAMLAAVRKAGVKHFCGFSYRFAPAVMAIKKMIRRGELGRIYHYRAAFQQDWILDPQFPLIWKITRKGSGSGVLGDLGAHVVDMCHNLIGPVSEVAGSLRTFVKERPLVKPVQGRRKGKVDVDDAAVFLGHIADADTLATFEVTRFAAGRRNYNRIEIYGSKGSVIWNQEDMNVFQYYNVADPPHVQGFRRVHATDAGHPYTEAWWPSGHIIGYEHLFVHELYEFLTQLHRARVSYPTFEDGLNSQKVLDAVERAVKTRRWEQV